MKQLIQATWVTAFLVLSSASSCDQETVAGRNNLDRPTDLLIIEEGEGGDSYVVVANPRAKTLRFFNITDGLFEPAPNLAFPLATIIGSGTRSLAQAASNASLIFALDTTLAEVYTIQMRSDDQQAFTHARAPFRTQSNPNQIAVYQDGSETDPWDIWVASHTPPQINRYALKTSDLTLSLQGSLPLDAAVNHMAFAEDGQHVFVGLASSENNLQITSRANPEQVLNVTVPFVIQELKVGSIPNGDGTVTAIWVMNSGGTRIGLIVFDPATNAARYLGGAEAPAPLQTFYVPQTNTDNTCCDGLASELKSDQWLSSIDAEGNLFYWKWALEGDSFDALQLDFQLFDSNPGTPSAEMTCTTSAGEDKSTCGDLTLAKRAASQTPWDNWILDGPVTWVYEGAPNGLQYRPVLYSSEQDGFVPVYGTFPTAVAFTTGDEVALNITSETESCTGEFKLAFESLNASLLKVGLMENALATCLTETQTISVSVHPLNSFALQDERHGTLQAVRFNEGSFTATLGEWNATFTPDANATWARGDEIQVTVSAEVSTVGMYLAQNFSYQTGGFGTFGNYAVAMVGGAVKIKNSGGEINDTHRVYLLSETGSLFEFTEGETDLSEVLSYK